MSGLSERDLKRLSRFLHRSYSICGLPEFRNQVVTSLPEVLPSDVTVFNEVDTRRRQLHHVTNPPAAMDFPDSVRIFEEHMYEHPLIAFSTIERKQAVVKISDFMSMARFRELGIYREFFRRVGTDHQMVCVIGSESSPLIGIAVNRHGKDFSERERNLLALALPHLRQAYDNAAVFTRMSQALALTRRDESAVEGLVVLDREGKVKLISRRDQLLLWKYFGRKSASGGIPDRLLEWIGAQSHCLSDFSVPAPLFLRGGSEQLTVRLFPDQQRYLLLLRQNAYAASRSSPAPTKGLTQRESEILGWVARGKTNSSIAAILSIRVRTVEKHLERIYEKLGVENRTAAAAQFLEMH
ncbi:MAG TPA: LuxR C-terminal-related transcriptional regulator [Terracidiphilus sp.]|nr:LuxR C-terminal-related transcriptional regulator [Terracidiphilus sp.]